MTAPRGRCKRDHWDWVRDGGRGHRCRTCKMLLDPNRAGHRTRVEQHIARGLQLEVIAVRLGEPLDYVYGVADLMDELVAR